MEVNKSQLEAGIKAYQLSTQILSNLTTENEQLKQEVASAHSILSDVLAVLVDEYTKKFPATPEVPAPKKSRKKKAK